MKILVPIKQVEILDEEFDVQDDGKSIDPDCIERELNQWDDYSWETALQLMEKHEGAVEAVPMTVGDEDADEGLRKCLAKGGERAIRVWDDSVAGSDSIAIARLIAATAKKEGAQLVLAGTQSTDHAHGQTGIATAALLGWPHVAVVSALEYAADTGKLTVRRELEGGLEEEIEVALPAVLTIQLGINEPRYASLRGIKQAKSKTVDVLSPSDLGVSSDQLGESGSAARVRRMYIPERSKAELITGTPSEQVKRLIEIVTELKGA